MLEKTRSIDGAAATDVVTGTRGEGALVGYQEADQVRDLFGGSHAPDGLDGGELKAPDGKAVSLRSMNVLLEPKTNQWTVTSGGGQHGMSMDDFGRVFVSGNSEPIHTLAYDARYLKEGLPVPAPAAAVTTAVRPRNSP